MGAAAVFETAAETPPTVDKPSARVIHKTMLASGGCNNGAVDRIADRNRQRSRRTQKVDDESLKVVNMLASVSLKRDRRKCRRK